MEAPGLHEDIEHLAFLLGTWRGTGTCTYPTITTVDYEEEIVIEDVGEAFLTYFERSWSPEDGAAIHLERGFLIAGADGEVELTLAHPIGLTEVAYGRVDGTTVRFATEPGAVVRTRTGLAAIALERRYEVEGDRMSYVIDMATEATPMARHLEATLRKRP